ncbi:MAG: ion transporter [Chloroflexi bacterium]|nr:ion transporter [Chloroflexota bacterium]
MTREQGNTLSQEIHDFFERPSNPVAWTVQAVIYALILFSVASAAIEYLYTGMFDRYRVFFTRAEHVVLGVFTIEYVAKLATAPSRRKFAVKPLSIIDFLAIFPGYLAILLPFVVNTSEVRALRLLRLLRFSRVLRILKLLRMEFFGKLFRFNNTILQAVLPVIVLFIVLKGIVWTLEYHGFWVRDLNLGELFAIIGFALGIALAQKVATTYEKFLGIEESVVRLAASLSSLREIIDYVRPGEGTCVTHAWGSAFLRALQDREATSSAMVLPNRQLYQAVGTLEQQPAEMAVTYAQLVETATYCLNRKMRLTPRPYDSMLQQATVLYLAMLALFLPGWAGMLSVLLGTYVLYGLYHLTQDLDSIVGGEFRLISIDLSELERFVQRDEVPGVGLAAEPRPSGQASGLSPEGSGSLQGSH